MKRKKKGDRVGTFNGHQPCHVVDSVINPNPVLSEQALLKPLGYQRTNFNYIDYNGG